MPRQSLIRFLPIGWIGRFVLLRLAARWRSMLTAIFGVLLVAILSPLAAMLVQTAISRTREFEADRVGAGICGKPLWLASALGKLEEAAERIDNRQAEANPATAHLFIVNPLHAGRFGRLFSTHPSTEERIRRLREMAGVAGPWG